MALSSPSTSSSTSLLSHLDDLKFQIDELEVKLGMSRMEVISPDEPLEQLLESQSNRRSLLERRTLPDERDFSYLVLSEEILRRTNGRRSIVTTESASFDSSTRTTTSSSSSASNNNPANTSVGSRRRSTSPENLALIDEDIVLIDDL